MDVNVLFVSHGGGPLPLLGDPGHKEMVAHLKILAQQIAKPSEILLISAHWEETDLAITAGERPALIYDYYGFPPQAYEIQYPCSGSPELADKVHALFLAKGFSARLDLKRGFDHGMFVPLKIMYPEADVPCVQVSLLKSLDPETHIDIGSALSGLDYDSLLVIGSGFSFHNMRAFLSDDNGDSHRKNEAFEKWLTATLSSHGLSETKRRRSLINWEKAPGARYCHPREEHLLPLLVCYGFAQTACSTYYEVSIMKKKSSFYLW